MGAPYEKNLNSKNVGSYGAIYIYRGHKSADKIKLSQKIHANDIVLPSTSEDNSLRAFGYSLSGGLDLDSNTYPDLAVGSLNSNAVLLLRTLPIVHLKAYVLNKDNLQDIDQKVKQCKSPKRQAWVMQKINSKI